MFQKIVDGNFDQMQEPPSKQLFGGSRAFVSSNLVRTSAVKSISVAAINALRPLFSKFLIPGTTCGLYVLLDDWLKSTSPTNHTVGYLIR